MGLLMSLAAGMYDRPRMGPPRDSYGLPPNHDWRLSEPQRCIDYHEFLVSPPPIRFDEGRTARSSNGSGTTTPKPQSPAPRVIPGDTP